MKRAALALALICGLVMSRLWAEDVADSNGTPSIAVTGETKSAAKPAAMTDRLGGPVFVTLTRSALSENDLPSSVAVVKPEEYRRFGARTAGEALLHATSLQTLPTGELGAPLSARIRGSTPNETLVLIDGRPVAGAALGTQDLSEISEEQIDHIEILRGGVAALYGPNAIGGVINVITKRATYAGLPVSHVGYESADFGRQTYRLDFGSRLGPADFFLFGNRARESGFRSNSDASTYNIGGNVGVSIGGAGKLILDVATYSHNAGTPGTIMPPLQPNQFNNSAEKLAATPNARATTDMQYARTSYILPLPQDSFMTFRLYGLSREETAMDSDHAVNTDRRESSKGGEAQFNLPWGFVAGGSFVHDREDHTDRIVSTQTFIRSAENYGFFAQDTLRRGSLRVIPSGRFDHNSQGGDTQNPRVQTLWDTFSWLRFSASAARAYRIATMDEIQLNPVLRPEHGWTYDAGFEIHPDSFSFRASYFRADVTDLIQTTSGTLATATNIGTARRQGAEIELSHVVSDFFRYAWNYTYLENRGIPQGFANEVTLANSPRHSVNGTATLSPTARWTIDATARYLSARFSDVTDPTGSALGSMVLFDMRASYAWRQLDVYFGVNDLTDRRYEEVSGFPLPGRTLYGGVSLRLWG